MRGDDGDVLGQCRGGFDGTHSLHADMSVAHVVLALRACFACLSVGQRLSDVLKGTDFCQPFSEDSRRLARRNGDCQGWTLRTGNDKHFQNVDELKIKKFRS